MSLQKIILIGSGGHCKSVIDVIEACSIYSIEGILAHEIEAGELFLGYPVLGGDEEIERLIKAGFVFHIAIGQIASNAARVRLYERITRAGGIIPTIISPKAYVSRHASLSEGSIIMHYAFINASVTIGANCIINTGAVIEHDCIIGSNCHVATGAYVNGNCIVEDNSFIGSNATIIQGIKIGSKGIIAAGSVVIKNTLPEKLYAGNPATQKK
jgi:sugar O-acyltransferase (sialic acid O-acetyltransferase NeuD family)